MTRRIPLPPVDHRAEQELLNAQRAERRVHILAAGGNGHPTGKHGDCPRCPLAMAQGDARRNALWLAR